MTTYDLVAEPEKIIDNLFVGYPVYIDGEVPEDTEVVLLNEDHNVIAKLNKEQVNELFDKFSAMITSRKSCQ